MTTLPGLHHHNWASKKQRKPWKKDSSEIQNWRRRTVRLFSVHRPWDDEEVSFELRLQHRTEQNRASSPDHRTAFKSLFQQPASRTCSSGRTRRKSTALNKHENEDAAAKKEKKPHDSVIALVSKQPAAPDRLIFLGAQFAFENGRGRKLHFK